MTTSPGSPVGPKRKAKGRASNSSSSGQEPQRKAHDRRRAEREQHRPTGPPPPIDPRLLGLSRWHFWEWGGDGKVSAMLAREGVVCGPPVNWKNGWDLENPRHVDHLLAVLEQYRPELPFTSPDYKDLRSLHRGDIRDYAMVAHDQSRYEVGLEAWRRGTEVQHNPGGDYLSLIPHKAVLWGTRAAMAVRNLRGTRNLIQPTDQCPFGLKTRRTAVSLGDGWRPWGVFGWSEQIGSARAILDPLINIWPASQEVELGGGTTLTSILFQISSVPWGKTS